MAHVQPIRASGVFSGCGVIPRATFSVFSRGKTPFAFSNTSPSFPRRCGRRHPSCSPVYAKDRLHSVWASVIYIQHVLGKGHGKRRRRSV